MPKYLVRCAQCNKPTSRRYASGHAGLCKACVEPDAEGRNERPVCHAEQTHAFRSLEAELDACPY